MTLLVAFLGLAFLILIHELGHFIAAKIAGVKVEEFMIGLPGPKIIKFRFGETLYGVTAIPFGGYVKLHGDVDVEEEERSKLDTKRAFLEKPFFQRVLIIFFGPLFNLILSVFLFMAVFLHGIPGYPTTTVDKVLESSAAERAGFQPGDTVLKIDKIEINKWQDLVDYVKGKKGKKITVIVKRDSRIVQLYPVVGERKGVGFLGLQAKTGVHKLGVIDSFLAGVKSTYDMTLLFLNLLFTETIKGTLLKQSAGPVGIVVETTRAVKVGLDFYLYLLSLISINLAIVNLIPIPPLDGGRIALMVVEKITGRKISTNLLAIIQLFGIILFFVLMIYLIQADIQRYHLLGAGTR